MATLTDPDANRESHENTNTLMGIMDREEDLEDAQNAYENDLSKLQEVAPSADPDTTGFEDVSAAVERIVGQNSKRVKDNTNEDYER